MWFTKFEIMNGIDDSIEDNLEHEIKTNLIQTKVIKLHLKLF